MHGEGLNQSRFQLMSFITLMAESGPSPALSLLLSLLSRLIMTGNYGLTEALQLCCYYKNQAAAVAKAESDMEYWVN